MPAHGLCFFRSDDSGSREQSIFTKTDRWIGLLSVCPQSSESELESSLARLAKFKKAEFTGVIEHFLNKRNAARGLYRQTLLSQRNRITAWNARSPGGLRKSERKHQLAFGQLRNGKLLCTQGNEFVCFGIFPLPGAAWFK